ncbi:hypothetical protein QFZ66_007660 [Streptomyces sp. B4I13]|nr:hypothetical protein [Streptomyces sp. B4I13]
MPSIAETHVEPDWYPEEDQGGRSRGGGLRSPERYAEYTRLRRECPVAFSSAPETHAPLTRYADVGSAAVNTARFRSDPSTAPFIGMPLGDQIPITLNSPEHGPCSGACSTATSGRTAWPRSSRSSGATPSSTSRRSSPLGRPT